MSRARDSMDDRSYPVAVRWQYDDPALIWLVVPAYLAHLVEELAGGFPAWVAQIVGGPLPLRAFLIINAIALIGMIVGVRAATRFESARWFAIAVASALGLNGLLHLAGTVLTGMYSPGLITGIVFYLPLAMLTLVRAAYQAPASRFWGGIAAGFALHAAVIVAALVSVWAERTI